LIASSQNFSLLGAGGGYNLSSSVGELSAMLLHIASDKELRDGVSPEVLAVVDGDVAQVFATSIIRGKYITDLPTQTYLKIIKLAAQQMVRRYCNISTT
jgi:hypothetical protein